MHATRILAGTILVAFLTPTTLRIAVSETHLTFIEPDPATGTSKAVITDNLSLVHAAQILPFDAPGQIISRDALSQTERVLAILAGTLVNFNCDYATITKLNIYISNPNDIRLVHQALARTFTRTNKLAATFVVSRLPNPAALVAIDAVAVPRLKTDDSNSPKPIVPPNPYDREIKPTSGPASGPLVYVSGMADTNSLPEATRITLGKLMSAVGHWV